MRTISPYERGLVASYMEAIKDRDAATLPVCPTCEDELDLVVSVEGEVRRVVHPMPACPEFIEFMENRED